MEQIQEMPDLFTYELEDIVWDEFDGTDDHIVPHQNGNELAFKGNRGKKRWHEVTDILTKSAHQSTAKYANQGKADEGFQPLKNTGATMLEKDSWSHTPEGVFPASRDCDSNKEVASLASDSTRISMNCCKSSKIDTIGSGFCNDGPIIGEGCDEVDSNSYCYSVGNISQTENALSFYNSITNYDDVNGIFSCDSMFGNEGGLNWLASPHNIEGSEGVLMSDFKFSCLESSMLKEDDGPNALGDWPFVNGSNPVSESNVQFIPEEIIFHENEAKHHTESEGQRKDQCLQNGSFNIRSKDMKLPFGDSARRVFTSPQILKQEENLEPASLGYLQPSIACMLSEYSHFSDQFSASATSTGSKSTSGFGSFSAKESSYASNPVSMDIYHEYLFEAPSVTMGDKRENRPLRGGVQRSFSSNPNHVDLLVHTASCDPISVSKHVPHSHNEVENHSVVEGVGNRMPADLETSNVQEASCMSSGFDEISVQTSSFRHLQQVMEQLDTSTKLCIRDSLYRLARSAEQRHYYTNLNGGSMGDIDNGSAMMDEGTNDCNGLMEIETDTNPIDRSIAHMLFYRLTDSSAMPTLDDLSLKPSTMIQESI